MSQKELLDPFNKNIRTKAHGDDSLVIKSVLSSCVEVPPSACVIQVHVGERPPSCLCLYNMYLLPQNVSCVFDKKHTSLTTYHPFHGTDPKSTVL